MVRLASSLSPSAPVQDKFDGCGDKIIIHNGQHNIIVAAEFHVVSNVFNINAGPESCNRLKFVLNSPVAGLLSSLVTKLVFIMINVERRLVMPTP